MLASDETWLAKFCIFVLEFVFALEILFVFMLAFVFVFALAIEAIEVTELKD